jgi:hypothetical protein
MLCEFKAGRATEGWSGATSARRKPRGLGLRRVRWRCRVEELECRLLLSDSALGRVAVVARYNADGTPDLTFGTGGRVVTDDAATAAAVQADGRLLLAGRTPDAQFLITRYLPAS